MADQQAGQGGHPRLPLDRIRRRIAVDLAQKSDVSKTFDAIAADVDELKASIQPYVGNDPLIGALTDTLQMFVGLCAGLAARVKALVEEDSGDAVPPAPNPAPPPQVQSECGGPQCSAFPVDPSRQ